MNNKIIAIDLTKYISNDKLNELRSIAKVERTYLNNRYEASCLKECLDRKAIEITYHYARYQDKNDIEKAIIASNIVFDSEKFATILSNGKETHTRRRGIKEISTTASPYEGSF